MDILLTFQEVASPVLCRPIFGPNAWTHWAVVCAVAAPHFLYAWIWFYPKIWQAVFGSQSVEVFSWVATFLKVVQFEAAILWVWSSRERGLCLDPSTIMLWQWLAFVLLVAFGQKLNVGIFQAIGVPGVYYGFKLGKKVPWVTGFPFNVISHPQYVGSVMTVWGVAAILYSQMPPGSDLQNGVIMLASYWSLLYVATGLIEQYV